MPEVPKRFKTEEEYEELPEGEKWKWQPTFRTRLKEHWGLNPERTYVDYNFENGKMWAERNPRKAAAVWGLIAGLIVAMAVI